MNWTNMRAVQKRLVRPLFMMRSNALVSRSSANLSEALRTTILASSVKDAAPCRMRHPNSRAALKNSWGGNCGSSTMRNRPANAMPFSCDMRVRVRNELMETRVTTPNVVTCSSSSRHSRLNAFHMSVTSRWCTLLQLAAKLKDCSTPACHGKVTCRPERRALVPRCRDGTPAERWKAAPPPCAQPAHLHHLMSGEGGRLAVLGRACLPAVASRSFECGRPIGADGGRRTVADTLIFDVRDGVGWIILNRPEA